MNTDDIHETPKDKRTADIIARRMNIDAGIGLPIKLGHDLESVHIIFNRSGNWENIM